LLSRDQVEEGRALVSSGAFDGKEAALGRGAAIGRETSELAACRNDPVAWHDDGKRIAPEGWPIARALLTPSRDAISP
jgi:hypothetical protein